MPVTVLVANQPRLMRELVVATISNQPDLKIVGEIQDEQETAAAVERTLPDFVIISMGRDEVRPAICDFLLQRYPNMRILALSPELNSGMSYRSVFHIQSASIEISEKGILDALRSGIEDPIDDTGKSQGFSAATEKIIPSGRRRFCI